MEKEEQMRQIHAPPRPVSYHLMYERGLVLHHIVWTVWTQLELNMSTVSCCLQYTRCNYMDMSMDWFTICYLFLQLKIVQHKSSYQDVLDPLLIAGSGMDHRPWRGSWRFWGLQWRPLRIDVLLLIDLSRDTEIHMIQTCFLRIVNVWCRPKHLAITLQI